MDIIELFRKATWRHICNNKSCHECHEFYGTTTCPQDYSPSDEAVTAFISHINDALQLPDEHQDITEEEFINILRGYCSD